MTDGSDGSGGRGDSETAGDDPSSDAHPGADAHTEQEEWRFGVDDVDEDGVIDTSIEPEAIDVENAVFVVVGVAVAVLILARTVTLFA